MSQVKHNVGDNFLSTRTGVKLGYRMYRAEERAGPEDVGEQALMRGLDTAFPFVRLGLSRSKIGRRSEDRPRSGGLIFTVKLWTKSTGALLEVRMFLFAIALAATTIVVVMLFMACVAMFKDVSEARNDLYDRIQVRRVVTSVSEEALAVYRKAQPFRHILEETAD